MSRKIWSIIADGSVLENEDAQTLGRKRRTDGEPKAEVKKVRLDDVVMTGGGATSSSDQNMQGGSSSLDQNMQVEQTSKKRQSDMSLDELEASIGQIICDFDGNEVAWDDVNVNIELPIEGVREARTEEMSHMKGKVFKVVKKSESYEKTGKAPKSTKWVDTDKSHGQGTMLVRSRWVARDFKTRGERDREDLFCATPPLELLSFMASRQATLSKSGRIRKSLFLDVRKAHLVANCEQDIYVGLPLEAGAAGDECGKLLLRLLRMSTCRASMGRSLLKSAY